MNTGYRKRPMLIGHGDNPAEAQPWKVKTADGRIRGPMGLAGLQSLLEVGILTQADRIAPVSDEHWDVVVDHPIWQQLQPVAKSFKLKEEFGENEGEEFSGSPTSPVTEERRLMMEALRLRERENTHQRLAWWQMGRGLRMVREVLIFLGFLTVGDLATSFFDLSVGLVNWAILLSLTAVAVMYYSFRVFDR